MCLGVERSDWASCAGSRLGGRVEVVCECSATGFDSVRVCFFEGICVERVLRLVCCLVESFASFTREAPSTGAGARASASPRCGAAPPTHRRCPAPPPSLPTPRRGARTRHAHPPPPPRPVHRCNRVDGECPAARPSRRRRAGALAATRGCPAHRPTADAGGASRARRCRHRAPRAATAPPSERSRRLPQPAALAVAPRRDAARRAGGRVRGAPPRCRAGASEGSLATAGAF